MTTCPKCGLGLSDDASFCPTCGWTGTLSAQRPARDYGVRSLPEDSVDPFPWRSVLALLTFLAIIVAAEVAARIGISHLPTGLRDAAGRYAQFIIFAALVPIAVAVVRRIDAPTGRYLEGPQRRRRVVVRNGLLQTDVTSKPAKFDLLPVLAIVIMAVAFVAFLKLHEW